MVQLQIISKILFNHDYSIIEDNLLTAEYFVGYENEFNFISNHVSQYNQVPDTATFLSNFPDIELVDCNESDQYLVDKIREEYLYYKSVPVIQKAAELLKTDANQASAYMINALKDLQPNYNLGGTNIIAQATDRYNQFIERKEHQDNWFFTTGFEQLDDIIHGIQREEELFVIVARTNQGKSWVLEKICTHIWQLGFNIGYISPEMGSVNVGYRFDTLYKNFSNKGLVWGKNDVKNEDYKQYIETLKTNVNKFIVATPNDFNRQITVSKLRNWVQQYKLDMIAIDGITYITDERYRRGDSKTITLTNISEDLMSLSMELKVPILVVVQANRGAVENEGTPELENIRDSDGIAMNASKVISIKQSSDGILNMEIKKQRFGMVGGKLLYQWNIDIGEFVWIPSTDDATPKEVRDTAIKKVRKQYKDKTDVF